MAVYGIVGAKFVIGAVVALKSVDWVAGDFTTPLTGALEVKEPQALGTYGDEWGLAEYTGVTEGRTKTAKTTRKAKDIEVSFFLDPTDAGQLALRAAQLVRSDYAMRIEFADKPASGASPKNSTRSFVGLVLECDDDITDAESGLQLLKVKLRPNSNIVPTNASPT